MRLREQTKSIGIALGLLLLVAKGSLSAGQPIFRAPPAVTPAQAIRILEALPQDGTRDGVPKQVAPATLCATDQEFMRKALAVITTEVEMAKLTAKLGNTAELRALSNELIIAQTKNGAALRELARLKIYEPEWNLSPEQEKLITSFRLQTPEAVASAYQEWVNNDRSGAIPVFTQGAKTVKDPLLRTLAEQILGELRTERPIAAAAIAAQAAHDRAPLISADETGVVDKSVNSSQTGKGSVGGKPGTKASKGKTSAAKTSATVRSRQLKGKVADTMDYGTSDPSTKPSNANRSIQTERDANGRIKMAPMISADVAEGAIRTIPPE